MWYLSHFVSFFKESHDKIDPHMSEAKKKKMGGVTVGKWSITLDVLAHSLNKNIYVEWA